MSCKIDCIAHNRERRSWEITPEGRVWPCCYFGNAWDRRHSSNKETDRLMQDTTFNRLMEEDPDWNHLDYHTLDEILNHEYFWNTTWYPGWESDNPHPICKRECQVVTNKFTGTEHARSVNRPRKK